MLFRKQRQVDAAQLGKPATPGARPEIPAIPASLLATEKIVIRSTGDGPRPLARPFPGPRHVDAALRVAFERRAYADLIAHAKESLEAEVCGVLAGQVCEDQEGLFVHVEAVIRGAAAAEASTHVTFTQATWTAIHKVLEQDYPKLRIVGWYHTHPGFGVEFSDLDLFIQKNFFSSPTQIALVIDPLSGAVAICVNTPDRPRYLPRFWVDAREQLLQVPVRPRSADEIAAGPASPNGTYAAIQTLEARVSQLVQVIDEQRASYHRFLLFCACVFCLAVIGGVTYFIYSSYTSKFEPPRLNSFAPIPVQVGDKTVLLGVGVVEWKVPDELNALMLQMELLKKLAAEKDAREAAAKGDTNTAPTTNRQTIAPPNPKSPAQSH